MKTLFDTTKINRRNIMNRFLVAPMTRVSADLKGVPTPEMLHYYKAFAEGGFGGIITEGIYTDNLYAPAYPNQPGLVNAIQCRAWQKVTDAIHQYPTLVIAQLMHAGAISQVLKKTKAPSAVRPLGEKLPHYGGGAGPFPVPKAMTEEDIAQVIEGFVLAAQHAVSAGFDGVELHAANGYLLDQFLTPYLNLRTDAYGGGIENSLHIIIQLVEAIRANVPADFMVGLRISEGKVNNLHYRWEGGSQTAKAILHSIKKLPLDYLHVAAEHHGWEAESVYEDGTSLTGLAKEITGFPVIANGKLHDITLAQQLLDTAQADLFAIGKAALSNPDFVKKVANNIPLIPFDKSSLYPNPSLFADSKHRMYLEAYESTLKQSCV